jgi:hypothetical protein
MSVVELLCVVEAQHAYRVLTARYVGECRISATTLATFEAVCGAARWWALWKITDCECCRRKQWQSAPCPYRRRFGARSSFVISSSGRCRNCIAMYAAVSCVTRCYLRHPLSSDTHGSFVRVGGERRAILGARRPSGKGV